MNLATGKTNRNRMYKIRQSTNAIRRVEPQSENPPMKNLQNGLNTFESFSTDGGTDKVAAPMTFASHPSLNERDDQLISNLPFLLDCIVRTCRTEDLRHLLADITGYYTVVSMETRLLNTSSFVLVSRC